MLLGLSLDLPESMLKDVAKMLQDQWGGDLLHRVEKLRCPNPSNNHGSYVLFDQQDDVVKVIGHAELKPAVTINTNDAIGICKNAIVVSVIIHPLYRGKGFGKILMEKLEEVALTLGFAYIYLWTSDAVLFYQKSGYHACEPVSFDLPALKSVNVQTFESLLMKRLEAAGSSNSPAYHLPSSSSNESSTSSYQSEAGPAIAAVWLRKRLQYSFPVTELTALSMAATVEEEAKLLSAQQRAVVTNTTPSALEIVLFRSFFLSRQVGPSCGVAALTMALSHLLLLRRMVDSECSLSSGDTHKLVDIRLNESERLGQTLLRRAVAEGYSSDGEIFNITDLKSLADSFLLTDYVSCGSRGSGRRVSTEVLLTEDALTAESLSAMFSSRGVCHCRYIILPYDRDPMRSTPGAFEGLHAHYAVVVGYVRDASVPGDVVDEEDNSLFSLRTVVVNSSSSSGAAEDVLVVALQSMSSRPVVAPLSGWLASNRQLRRAKSSGTAKSWKVDRVAGPQLAGLCLSIEVHNSD